MLTIRCDTYPTLIPNTRLCYELEIFLYVGYCLMVTWQMVPNELGRLFNQRYSIKRASKIIGH